jgi:hypothetical protein
MGIAERGHDVLLFDHTIDALPGNHPRFTGFARGSHQFPSRNARCCRSRLTWTSCRVGGHHQF